MSYGFNTPQPAVVEVPTLESSGLPGFDHELRKLKDKQRVKFIPLHAVDQSFTIIVHKKQFMTDVGYRYIPVGSRNSHLPFLNPPVRSPFEQNPDKNIWTFKTARYMLVFVVDGFDKLNGHVAYLELRDQWKKDGTYNIIKEWENNTGKSVEGRLVVFGRNGTGIQDTSYSITVTDPQALTAEQKAIADREAPEVRDYIVSLYDREWTLEEFRRLYHIGMEAERAKNNTAVDTKPEVVVTPEDETEIPF